MPNRKKSNISRKLPLVTRTTAAILDRVVGSGGAASRIAGSIGHSVDPGVSRACAVEGLLVPRLVHQLAALAEVADVLAARRQLLVGEGPAVAVVGLAGARAVLRQRWIARGQDEQQPGEAHCGNLLLGGAAEHHHP